MAWWASDMAPEEGHQQVLLHLGRGGLRGGLSYRRDLGSAGGRADQLWSGAPTTGRPTEWYSKPASAMLSSE